MSKFVINGGKELYGSIKVQGAKNSVLPLFAASILTDEKVIIKNVPNLIDVHNMSQILMSLGVDVIRYGNIAEITAQKLKSHEIHNKLAKELRSSIFLLGSILSRQQYAKVAYPGGCDIGLRPIDIHIKGLRELNVRIIERAGYIYCDATKIIGGEVNLDYPSVGATENVILAAVKAKGKTIIRNSACEPEIKDLQDFLNTMGAKVSGAGTSTIIIDGVEELHGTTYSAMPDRIVAGSLAIATAITGGEVTLMGANAEDINSLLSKLSKTSCFITYKDDNIIIQSKANRLAVENITTQPYPGFPTDLQAPMMALQTVSDGICIFTENVFENRFRHVNELKKMGADITINGRTAVIKGISQLSGAEVDAQDLRGGAALVLAGLNAQGTTIVNDIFHIDRGYEHFEEALSILGADIIRI
jgi:UDP-N-acetylglucosamine 1-carboxyvinyltransferase